MALALQLERAEQAAFLVVVEAGAALPELVELADRVAAGLEMETQVFLVEATDVDQQAGAARTLEQFARVERRCSILASKLGGGAVRGEARRAQLRSSLDGCLVRRHGIARQLSLKVEQLAPITERFERYGRSLLEPGRPHGEAPPGAWLGGCEGEAGRYEPCCSSGVSAPSFYAPLDRVCNAIPELLAQRRRARMARHELTVANLRLVITFARRSAGRRVAFADLIQEGNVGLMRAVDKYDPRMGTRFSTYAAWWIRQAIQRAIHDQGRTVRVPTNVSGAQATLARETQRLAMRLGREPELEQIATELCMEVDAVQALRAHNRRELSLDTPAHPDGRTAIGDAIPDSTLPPDEIASNSEDRVRVQGLLECLNAREHWLICLRFGIGLRRAYTLAEVGEQLGLTRERIRQIEVGALAKLRGALHRHGSCNV